MIRACEKASKIIIRDFGEIENLQVSKKGPEDFVTKTDKRVEEILIDELSKNRKKYSFITEETGLIMNDNKDILWIIDPIDGTTNFMHGIPHFAISLALQRDEEIISGIIFDPIKNELFYAEKDNGSYFNNNRVRVSKKTIASAQGTSERNFVNGFGRPLGRVAFYPLADGIIAQQHRRRFNKSF